MSCSFIRVRRRSPAQHPLLSAPSFHVSAQDSMTPVYSEKDPCSPSNLKKKYVERNAITVNVIHQK